MVKRVLSYHRQKEVTKRHTNKSYLIASGHDCYNWEFLHLHLCDSYSGQEADLRWTHVSALRQHTLSTLDIMSYRPVYNNTGFYYFEETD